MAKKKETPKHRYQVEWCDKIPTDENGDAIMDNAHYVTSNCQKFEDAIGLAKAILKAGKDMFGDVVVAYQEVIIDPDVLEHEGWERKVWHTFKVIHVSDQGEYKESEMETPA